MLEEGLLQVLEEVYEQRNLDFRQYKESSLKRRIERRLRATKIGSYNQYMEVLVNDPNEYERLIDNLTIKVTEFFRNPGAWYILRDRVLPEIIEEKMKTESYKTEEGSKPRLWIWCAGCATGEEVYSVATVIAQFLGERKNNLKVSICGTDIDSKSLLKARQAKYKPDMVKAVPEDILNRYFTFNSNFRVRSSIRNVVYFRSHDLVLDEPLKQMDLIICRNVAIYFTRPLQMKIFMDFYNGLNEQGYLFLGKAETLIGPAREGFKVINKQWRIYQKNDPGKN
jgi:chemotaxis methyl-accepting protein methylase